MALVQVGMGLGRIVLLAGAGLAGSVAIRNGGNLSGILAELQVLRDKDAGGSGGGSTVTDALLKSVQELTVDVRKITSEAAVVYVDAAGKGVASSLVAPAAAAGALGYGYMRWKGISISSVMYVTKQNMANAVARMTKHLEQIQGTLADAKNKLTRRIKHLDDRLDQQRQISEQIRDEVTGARMTLQGIGSEMQKMKEVARGLDGKLDSIEATQNYSLAGVMYLVQFIEQNGGRLPHSVEHLQRTAKLSGFTGDQKQLQGLGQLLAIESGTPLEGHRSTSARLFNAAA
uniref:DUF1664 domain-containing protein n=1 Tax=Leersia perrieri TaxID=77586 RepID=A0A0D9UXN0_9ORYZ